MANAIVIPVEGPVYEIDIPDSAHAGLAKLQELVGGYIEGVPIPKKFSGGETAMGLINEEGKFTPEACPPNRRATDFFVQGHGLNVGDYIAGTVVILGVADDGEPADVPAECIKRARLIEEEAS